MSFFRINKTSNYTVMANFHFKEKQMSLKSKGLLSLMLSLPENWNFSITGLVTLCKENKTAIASALNELKEYGYLKITKQKNELGVFEYIYDIYEKPLRTNPDMENPDMENLGMEKPGMENVPLLNTNKTITNKINTNKIEEKEKKITNSKYRFLDDGRYFNDG